MTEKNEDGKVGYGKPPKHSQFKTGQSGNRKGRPKGSRNFKNELQEMLEAKVTITKDGKSKKVTAREATLQRLLAKAFNGDIRAIERVMQLAERMEDEQNAANTRKLTLEDREVLLRFLEARDWPDSTARPQPEEGGDHDG